MKYVFTALTLCASLAATAAAQQSPVSADQDVQITVTAPTENAIQSFVGNIASAPQYAYQMGRWDHRVCPGVIGLQREQAQFIVDRIAVRAYQVGLGPGAPGCRANIAIFVTPDARLLAHNLVHAFGAWMDSHPDNYVKTSGQMALQEFEASDQPVRWWFVSEMTTGDGQHIHDARASGTEERLPVAAGFDGNLNFSAPVVRFNGSRLRSPTQQEFQRVIIVVDAQQVHGVSLQSLADYLAMVSLAQINPHQDVGNLPSILNLFNRNVQTSHAEMTAWDVAYLQGVYHMQRAATAVHFQRADITRRMEGALREPQQEQAPPQR